MARTPYVWELEELRRRVLELGTSVNEQLAAAIKAFAHDDLQVGIRVRDAVHEIDTAASEIEALCIDLIASHQPVAPDMRRITASFRLISDLERIGELAGELAENARASGPLDVVDAHNVAEAGAAVLAMSRDALLAYERDDEVLARAVLARDVDDRAWEIINELNDSLAMRRREAADGVINHERVVRQSRSTLFAMRAFERIGAHAGNIAEEVLFAVRI